MFNGSLWNSKNSNVNRSALTLQAASANDNIGKRTAVSMKAILETLNLQSPAGSVALENFDRLITHRNGQ